MNLPLFSHNKKLTDMFAQQAAEMGGQMVVGISVSVEGVPDLFLHHADGLHIDSICQTLEHMLKALEPMRTKKGAGSGIITLRK